MARYSVVKTETTRYEWEVEADSAEAAQEMEPDLDYGAAYSTVVDFEVTAAEVK